MVRRARCEAAPPRGWGSHAVMPRVQIVRNALEYDRAAAASDAQRIPGPLTGLSHVCAVAPARAGRPACLEARGFALAAWADDGLSRDDRRRSTLLYGGRTILQL